MGARASVRSALTVILSLVASVVLDGTSIANRIGSTERSATIAAAATSPVFSDVPTGSQFYSDVSWLAASGVTSGFTDGTFRGGSPVSRQAMAAFLFRFENYRVPDPICASGQRKFSDVPLGGFCGPIEWLAESGIASGFPDGTFHPGAPVSRQAMAAFLFRASGQANSWAPPTVPSFSDVPVSSPFFSEIEWLASTGITKGYTDGTFRPGAAVSRQAMAAFLHRLHDQPFNDDGTVWAWGQNAIGSLGAGLPGSASAVPVRVVGIADIVAIEMPDAGYRRLALRKDGTVWAWGAGAPGSPSIDNVEPWIDVPLQVPGLSGVKSILASLGVSYALKSDGTVWAWGNGYYGQLGTGELDFNSFDIPLRVVGLTDAIAIATDGSTAFALRSDGTVWSWGFGDYGQLGTGSFGRVAAPAQVENLTGVTTIASGNLSAYALKSDGTVWSWGVGEAGQLGNGAWENRAEPVQVANLTQVNAIKTEPNGQTVYAIRSDGSLWAWGASRNGVLGNGAVVDTAVPVEVVGLEGVISVAATTGYSSRTVYALKADGTVWAWGANNLGQLGDGSVADSAVPIQVAGLPAVAAISASDSNGYALTSSGEVWAWGYGWEGRLGNGQLDGHDGTPVRVGSLGNVTTIGGANGNGFALISRPSDG